MSERITFGRHVGVFFEPDLVCTLYRGDVSKDEGRRMSEWFSPKIEGRDARFLVDIRELGNIPPDARKELASQRSPTVADRDFEVNIAFIGATLRTKVLMTVVVAAASITSNVKVKTQYFPDVAAAATWAKVDAGDLAF